MNTVRPSSARPLVASAAERMSATAVEPFASMPTQEHGLPGPVDNLKHFIRILMEF